MNTIIYTKKGLEAMRNIFHIMAMCLAAIVIHTNTSYAQSTCVVDLTESVAMCRSRCDQGCLTALRNEECVTACNKGAPASASAKRPPATPKVARKSGCEESLAAAAAENDRLRKRIAALQEELSACKDQLQCQADTAANAAKAAADAAEAKRLAKEASFNAWNAVRIGIGCGILLLLILLLCLLTWLIARKATDEPPPNGGKGTDPGTKPTEAAPKGPTPPPVPSRADTMGRTSGPTG